jgi:ribonuclease HI
MGETISASFDGACEPSNPGGHMGLGWVIDGAPCREYIPAAYQNTNDVAEYLALSKVLEHAIQAGATTLMVTGDSSTDHLPAQWSVCRPVVFFGAVLSRCEKAPQ